MKGWRRIGIVLSVLAFFPLGIFIWMQPSVSESLYEMQMNTCGTLRRFDVEAMDQIRDNMDQWYKRNDDSKARYETVHV